MTPSILSFLCNADLSIPINLAVLGILPPNFFNWVVKYSFSKDSLASLKGTESVSVTDTLSVPLREARESFEKEYLTTQLKKFGGNISKTAKFVGMERSALHRKLKLLGVKDLN